MIRTMLRVSFINMRRDRVVQAMVFLLPVLFFSIFALVFGQQRDPMRKIPVALVDEDQSEFSKKLAAGLAAEGALAVRTTPDKGGQKPTLDRAAAEKLVKDGDLPVALILPKGLGEHSQIFGAEPGVEKMKVQLLADVSDPISPQVVAGLLQKVSFTAMPDRMADQGMAMFSKYGGGLTPQQETALATWKQELKTPDSATSSAVSSIGLPVETINVLQPEEGNNSLVSFYAAGVGVMFLLFSCSGAGGVLLDEEESGTLGRLLGSRLGMRGVLLGKWTFIWIMGMMQLGGHVHRGPTGVRPSAHDASSRLHRDDAVHGRRGLRLWIVTGDDVAEPAAVVGHLDDCDPHDAGAGRQHVPAVPDERDDAEDGLSHVQRVGA